MPSRVLTCDFGLKATGNSVYRAVECPDSGAGPAGSGAEMTQHDATPTFSTGVNLVLVPVVVRDGSGKAIGNLNREDFQLYDKGKLQYISRFYIERPAAPLKLHNDTVETDAEGAAKANDRINRRSRSPADSSRGSSMTFISRPPIFCVPARPPINS